MRLFPFPRTPENSPGKKKEATAPAGGWGTCMGIYDRGRKDSLQREKAFRTGSGENQKGN